MSAIQPYPVSEGGALREVAKEERALLLPVRKFEAADSNQRMRSFL
jgi:hypothetical protein